jgi:hypothetical protein
MTENNPNRYRQRYQQSCLVQCLAYLVRQPLTVETEGELLISALLNENVNIALGCAKVAGEHFGVNFRVAYHYKRFAEYLNELGVIPVSYEPISRKRLASIPTPYALYLDYKGIGSDVHEPHWVVVDRQPDDEIGYMDPAKGKFVSASTVVISSAVDSLKNTLHFSPAIILLT